MKITFIHHSSFLLEDDERTMLFDYFEGEIPSIRRNRPFLIFASHRHGDHFSPAIFDLSDSADDVRYVLSYDIGKRKVPERLLDRTTFLKAGERTAFDTLSVRTLKSTDEGVAFVVSDGKRTVYHAGDLNDWRWKGESDAWNDAMRRAYLSQIDELKDLLLDIAFVPVDPRLEEFRFLGAEELMERTVPKYLVPMHLWGDFSVGRQTAARWKEQGYPTHVLAPEHDGQTFVLPIS
ncbi:MAG: MBL fold metallo-hydrolase [Sphaerochaetaceae bacterium]|jgi:L-ascorbate metabolism protein UlaG (beta-lactamase superfamily)